MPNTSKQLEGKSEGLLDSALSRYRQAMALVNRVRVAAQALQNGIAGIQAAIMSEFNQLTSMVSSVEALADMLINAPDNFAAMIEGQFSGLGDWSKWPGGDDEEFSGYVSAGQGSAPGGVVHNRESTLGGDLLETHMREAISGATGEHDHKLIAPVGDVSAGVNELLTYGGVVWR
ncbi:hypothetical protein D3C77_157550 [compost metagenome]